MCDSTSQEFIALAVVRLEANGDKTAWIVMFMAGTPSITNMVAFSAGTSFTEQDGTFFGRIPEFWMETVCDTTSQESITKPVVRLEAKKRNRLDRHSHGGHAERLVHDALL